MRTKTPPEFEVWEKVRTEEVSQPAGYPCYRTTSLAALACHFDLDEALLSPVAPECMRVSSFGAGAGVDARPAQLLYVHECRVDVSIACEQVRAEVQREPRGVQHMRGYLCQVCVAKRSNSALFDPFL